MAIFFFTLLWFFAHGESKVSKSKPCILIPCVTVCLGRFLTVAEFFKLACANCDYFNALSKEQILKFALNDQIKPFATAFKPTFRDLLSLEFRLKDKRAKKLFFTEIHDPEIKLLVEENYWKFENIVAFEAFTLDDVLHSFTLQPQKSTFVLAKLEQIIDTIWFHYEEVKPQKYQTQKVLSLIFDLNTGVFRDCLVNLMFAIDMKKHKLTKKVKINAQNYEMFIQILGSKKFESRNKNLCVII